MTQTPTYDPQQPYVQPGVPLKKSHKVRNVVLAVVAVIVIIAVASGAGKKKDAATPTTAGSTAATPGASAANGDASTPSTDGSAAVDGSDPKQDVTITKCVTGAGGYLSATVKVVNHSEKASNYIVTVAFESKTGSEQLDTGLAAVNGLKPGQSSSQDAASLKTAPKGGFKCSIGDVTRYAS